jgi:hypothetical protein
VAAGGQTSGKGARADPSTSQRDGSDSPKRPSRTTSAEEIIRACRKKVGQAAFHVICFGDRPLQAIPPGRRGAHIVLFSHSNRAEVFVGDRATRYTDEEIDIVAIPSIALVLQLARATSSDPNYVKPPCGMIFDFSYSALAARLILSPAEVDEMSSSKFARAISK